MVEDNSYDLAKPSTGQCQSYVDKRGARVRCDQQGVRRYDHGLDSGVHCDPCWEKLLSECRQRSW